MKVKPIYLVDDRAKEAAIVQLMQIPADGTVKVVFSNSKDKSSRQRGLQWRWYTDVVKAGVGGTDQASEARLHLVSKYMWCLPIQIRDDDHFADLWMNYYNRHTNDAAALEWFVDNHCSTEALDTSQMAEYLTKFQEYYAFPPYSVNLTDPDELGWRNLLGSK